MEAKDIDRHWKRIIDTMTEGLMLVSRDGTILMVNRSFEQMTGYSAEEVIGKSCTLLHCDNCEKLRSDSEDGSWCALFDVNSRDQKRCRCGIIRKDGTCMPSLKNASVLKDNDGKVMGAVETITDLSEMDRLDQEVKLLTLRLQAERGFESIVGESGAMQKVFDVVRKAALSDAPVIIYGESGTGKELVARAIHDLGLRAEGPFIQLNCAALNESLLESELFGHIKGAFTGAYRHKIGRFEAADGGDIFLDEIGDVPSSIQVKLLRVLETKQFERVGDHRAITVDARIITATNRDLGELMAQKKFREDLFFRINVIPIRIPPLRERVEDIPLLVQYFINGLRTKTAKPITGVSRSVLEHFMAYPWPGNVRELKSAMEYAFVVAESGLIGRTHLPPNIFHSGGAVFMDQQGAAPGEVAEKRDLIEALRRSGGNQSKAARILGINRVTVWNRMKKYGIDLKKTMTL
ncbi:MAG: sigma 54-interacting transcriptional regulator [Desulfobacterales bacterium]|nr:sigma 54-interacting transcriptional regulator [Desulfobacterales bacterium]